MSESLYEHDFYAWTQQQADALRLRLTRANEVDWDHVAEEIEDMGAQQRRASETFTMRIIEHLIKLHCTASVDPVRHWKQEIDNFRLEVKQRQTPTIERALRDQLETLHVDGARRAAKAFRRHEPGSKIDPTLRWTWEEITGEGADDPLDHDYPRPPNGG